jgi:hypothetical protein
MLTVAVAARQPKTQRRYRAVLGQLGVDSHFVTDSDLLIKCVRSRPVSVVIFDLDDPHWPARKWLEVAALDVDLGVIPILWIGTEVSGSDLQTIENYQPGFHLPKFPDANTLLRAIETLSGDIRQTGERGLSAAQALATPAWKPEVDTIDDALSIFADPASGQAGSELGPPVHDSASAAAVSDAKREVAANPDGDYGVIVAEMTKSETPTREARSDSGFIEVAAQRNVEKGVVLSKPHIEIPGRTAHDDDTLINRIAEEVTARLAGELLKNLDATVIRHAVEDALARRR